MKTAAGTTVITNGQLIDGRGSPPVRDAALVVHDGKIKYAGPVAAAPALPPDAARIDARGGTILPGLVEAHYHPTYFNVAALEDGTFMDDEALELLMRRNTPVVPALQFEWASIEHGPEFGMPQKVIDGHKETLEDGAESARRILRAGGRLGMGGDYGFFWNPHGTYAKELTFFVSYVGLKPVEVIRCATLTGAEVMGRDKEFGPLEAGKLADVLVVDGDVAADVSVLEDRSPFIAVLQGGVVKAAPPAGPPR